MRRRITRTLLAAAAAGVTVSTLGFTAAGAASAAVATKAQPATIGTSIASTTSAGYQASGRDFRYISSTITVPDTDFLTGLYPQEYIQLSNGSLTQFSGGGDQYDAGRDRVLPGGPVVRRHLHHRHLGGLRRGVQQLAERAVLLPLLQPGGSEPG